MLLCIIGRCTYTQGLRQQYYCMYRSVPLIRPPFCALHPAQSGEGAYFRIIMHLVSTIRPLKKFCYVHKRSPVQFVDIKRGFPTSARRAATSMREPAMILMIHDNFAVAVLQNNNTVGHVPRDISWYFLQKSGSEITCIVDINSDYSQS